MNHGMSADDGKGGDRMEGSVVCRFSGKRVKVRTPRETAVVPVERVGTYLKYGFVITEHQYMECPRCGDVLGAGPDYQPKYCCECGQRLSFSGIVWKEDRHLGYAEGGDAHEPFRD